MPKQRIYTSEGFLEVQWDHSGLVCVVSGVQKSDSLPENFDTHMHQFTAEDSHEDLKDLKDFGVALHRATFALHRATLNKLGAERRESAPTPS